MLHALEPELSFLWKACGTRAISLGVARLARLGTRAQFLVEAKRMWHALEPEPSSLWKSRRCCTPWNPSSVSCGSLEDVARLGTRAQFLVEA
ncbi:hypothetical protein RRG08_066240 [Elysia crispata]|uniref:Uncharacterized protein n=1 Tax=Elysia crispata TaxID=231223 RepID=A0AAE1BDK9_9GAST|nr:hypothetical protein RRG08_066240 [Elysia crispata]